MTSAHELDAPGPSLQVDLAQGSTPLVGTPRPSPSKTTLQAPPAGPLFTIAAIVAVAFALAAAVIGYRIIRGGRGL